MGRVKRSDVKEKAGQVIDDEALEREGPTRPRGT